MTKYLIDVNLPRYFSLWNSDQFVFVVDINDEMTDTQIWQYAKEKNLTIVSKDADFSDLALLNDPPPRVIHLKFGNMKMSEFHQHLVNIWSQITSLSNECRLVRVYKTHIEGID